MDNLYKKMNDALKHLQAFHDVFKVEKNFTETEINDYKIYKYNLDKITKIIEDLDFDSQLYSQKGRQMILADLFEYILLGRGYYSIQTKDDKENFVRLILHFVNLLMSYETLTVSDNLREKVLEKLKKEIPEITLEEKFPELKGFKGKIGLKEGESEAPKELNKYFDSLLPKTAGGLWHELLVYVFLLRSNVGYIIPLLLSQRLLGFKRNIIPPDFLIITYDKNLYGVEVGTKKEIQSGAFSLQTTIPTATIDTINSRTSDRCPICERWIPFCEFVIDNYSNFSNEIKKTEIRCLEDCNIHEKDDIAAGKCPYTKYSRKKVQTLLHTHHGYANGLHYHYRCVLENVDQKVKKEEIVAAKDKIALKTHYPYYSGLEELMKKME
ncbi:MAG TPA: hypothetical protein P5124_02365 [Syntrophorhabdaceae bacterium]|nr:hypothetical protein [Syntrophorhabdaceae bacterium]HRR71112.1 hypothetical protein [Syntrophorhabdaceae bacterium]HRV21905.1 hypothetical protein [Syntrophorhabdaceae bacterium]